MNERNVIYEVNIRQFTPKGDFKSFLPRIERIANMGVTTLWFMPIFPIGEIKRKGTLGSYYSIKDYKAVNKEFGTIKGFKSIVEKAHSLGMKVILDMALNHTSWDNVWMSEDEMLYAHDENGEVVSPFDWTDTAKLDYNNPKLRAKVTDAMKFWVEECNIDGYRQDMAGLVPLDFWEESIAELRAMKPDIYMLGEVEAPEYVKEGLFDACYGWETYHFTERIANQQDTVDNFRGHLMAENDNYPAACSKMLFISNHDENSWHDSEFKRFGDAVDCMRAFNFVYRGTPLVYSGEEAGCDKKIEFFEKDVIDWTKLKKFTPIFKELINLKLTNEALCDSYENATPYFINSSQPYNVMAFKRKLGDSVVIGVFNMTPHHIQPAFYDEDYQGKYSKLFHGEVELESGVYDPFGPWEFKIYYK
ncbi:MAG: alpha-amylase family glycosyl hydrolase [Rikenellaceae bacterium]